MSAPASVAAAGGAGLRTVEWAGPELLDAARAALPALRGQLLALLEIGCDWRAGAPVRATLAAELVDDVAQLEDAIEALELAELKATTPWDELPADRQAAIIARFPPPMIEEFRLG